MQEEEPVARRDAAAQDVPPAEVDHDHRPDIGHQHKHGEDAIIDEAGAHVDLVRLLVDLLELVVHVLFLAEVLGDGDAADHFLHTIERL